MFSAQSLKQLLSVCIAGYNLTQVDCYPLTLMGLHNFAKNGLAANPGD